MVSSSTVDGCISVSIFILMIIMIMNVNLYSAKHYGADAVVRTEAGIADCRVSECDRKTVPRCGTRNRKCSTAVCGQSVTWDHKCVLLSRPEVLNSTEGAYLYFKS